MPLMTDLPFRRISFSAETLRRLSPSIRAVAEEVARATPSGDSPRSLVVANASEILRGFPGSVPEWVDADTSYLVVADVPEPALFRIPTILRVHKPDQRIHVTRDPQAVKRQAIALVRDHPFEAVVDAWVLWRDVWVVLGDMTLRCFPAKAVPALADLSDADLADLAIHASGSYIAWREGDLRLGPSQLLQAVDPMYLADVLIDRYEVEQVSSALRLLREWKGLNQSDIAGLSERHVRRLEKEEVRLTSDAAARYAEAFGSSMETFLGELSSTVTRLRSPDTASSPTDPGSDLHSHAF